MKGIYNLPQFTLIIMNQKGIIRYSSIKDKLLMQLAIDYFKLNLLHIKSNIGKKTLENFIIKMEKVNLNDKTFYIITIEKVCQIYAKENQSMFIDTLTGLYNRNFWEHINSIDINILSPYNTYSIIMIDVDNMKGLNDTYGHLIGDKAIKIVGQAIKESIRNTDIAIRYGGDEFLILLPNSKKAGAQRVIERIKSKSKEKGQLEEIDINISTGFACSDTVSNLNTTIQQADNNMYKEKKSKKDKQNNRVSNLEIKNEIEQLRKDINNLLEKNISISSNEKVVKMSQKLDKLINDYMRKK